MTFIRQLNIVQRENLYATGVLYTTWFDHQSHESQICRGMTFIRFGLG